MTFKEFYTDHIPHRTLIRVYRLFRDVDEDVQTELWGFYWKNPNNMFPASDIGNASVEYSSWSNRIRDVWGPLDDSNSIGEGYNIPVMNIFLKE